MSTHVTIAGMPTTLREALRVLANAEGVLAERIDPDDTMSKFDALRLARPEALRDVFIEMFMREARMFGALLWLDCQGAPCSPPLITHEGDPSMSNDTGFVVDMTDPDARTHYEMASMIGMLKIEVATGLSHGRGSVMNAARRRFGCTKRTKQGVLDELLALYRQTYAREYGGR